MFRLEITIYGSKLYKAKYYQRLLDSYFDFLDECPTYKVSHHKQWKAIVKRVKQMMVVYVPSEQQLAYCHWWNSFTKRKQGLLKSGISQAQVQIILANFSFNDRPIHYFEVAMSTEGNKTTYEILKYIKYRREEGSMAITLVPGISNSLYPYRNQLRGVVLPFSEVGVCRYMNLELEWPESQLTRGDRQRALSRLVLWEEESSEATYEDKLELMEPISMPKFKPDYVVLGEGHTYKVTAYGFGSFRGKVLVCLRLDESYYVRCSPGLEKVVAPVLVRDGPTFSILIRRHKVTRGKHDLDCSLSA
ncbi:MAG: hypothetical protein EXX96DRAFT_620340 [Benjaminiella poitrasii]|nr:MAG: hypothetical protein EXX96DRAFT_620340 [Benjaminiella poitrasii]